MDNKEKTAAIRRPMIQALIVIAVFYAIEIALVYLNVFPDNNVLLCVDIALRIIGGITALRLMKRPLKPLFTNKLTPKIWLTVVPFLIYIALPQVKIFYADVYVPGNIPLLIIPIIQQFATGFFEESYGRGLFMDGLIRYNTATVKQRLFTVAVTGAFFGLMHFPNIAFGENPLVQVPSCAVWGFFIASVFMLSDNLLLVMLLHAFSDITPRIAKGLFGWTTNPSALQVIENARTVFEFIILPLAAVIICIKYDELRKRHQ